MRPSKPGSSPHTRGARPAPGHVPRHGRIIPAYAGSTVRSHARAAWGGDHPRIRGEHVRAASLAALERGSSPHTRGAPAHRAGLDCRRRIIPAYAGSTSGLPLAEWRRADHPRIRGEHEPLLFAELGDGGSSPHTRGARSGRWRPGPCRRIIPAYAGSTTSCRSLSRSRPDHPRIRGEHWTDRRAAYQGSGSSPHTRGARPGRLPCSPGTGIIPAYAGSTTGSAAPATSAADHPRIRGEHPETERPPAPWRGSSPHTRGAHQAPEARGPGLGIIPAYAGSTPWGLPRLSPTSDHPRIRGEHHPEDPHPRRSGGSSPHTRGAPAPTARHRSLARIIPAYAGSTAATSTWPPIASNHPRIRGEHATVRKRRMSQPESSPHTRGARFLFSNRSKSGWIIPAYAGSTRGRRRRGGSTRDHPRIRGEHSPRRSRRRTPRGSSPHTRGAHRASNRPPRCRRIIPAYAGSTAPTGHAPRAAWGSSPHTRGAPSSPTRPRSKTGIIPAYAGSTSKPPAASSWRPDHPRIRGEHTRKTLTRADPAGSSPHTRGARRWRR